MNLEDLPPSTDFTFEYYDHSAIKDCLDQIASKHPELVRIEHIGSTHEGREIWCAVVTNFDTGAELDKPAYYLDANIHAGEVTGSTVALYTIHYLCTKYGELKEIQSLLDKSVFYIVPRISADGAERYLHAPGILRSSTRFWPFPEKLPGMHREDMDGDGEILLMRIEDPLGDWKVSEKDPRLMLKRSIADHDNGPFYRLLPEGRIHEWFGEPLKIAPIPEGLDLNRNNPGEWAQECNQVGAGPFPLSEPETRTVADFIRNHPNICGLQSFHTFSGVILRPMSYKPDSDLETPDLEVFVALGKEGERLTGYPCINIYSDFKYEAKSDLRGGFLDWIYDHLGIFVFSTELWDMIKVAGIEKREYIKFLMYERTEEEELKLLKWNDEVTSGDGFVNWREFDHPQLGRVELGGWRIKYTFQNPPLGKGYLEQICHKNAMFAFAHARASPRLRFSAQTMMPVTSREEGSGSKGVWKISLVLENEGFLPTYVSKQAMKKKVIRDSELRISCEGDCKLLAPVEEKVKLPHLEGRSNKLRNNFFAPYCSEDQRWRYEFTVEGVPGSKIHVTAWSQKAGAIRTTFDLT